MREHSTTVIKANTKSTDHTKFWQRCRETGSLMHCWWVNGRVILEDGTSVSYKLKYLLSLQLSNHTCGINA